MLKIDAPKDSLCLSYLCLGFEAFSPDIESRFLFHRTCEYIVGCSRKTSRVQCESPSSQMELREVWIGVRVISARRCHHLLVAPMVIFKLQLLKDIMCAMSGGWRPATRSLWHETKSTKSNYL